MNNLDAIRLTYPRVSEIIGKQTENEMRKIPLEALANASIRGTKVHAYCSLYALDSLWMADVEDEYRPYLDAFIKWANESVEEFIFIGGRLYDDNRKFTGEPDMGAKLKGYSGISLIDIKTSANVSKSWEIQLAAYKHLCAIKGYPIENCFNLHLKKTKTQVTITLEGMKIVLSPSVVKPILIEQKYINRGWEIFDSSLKCYDYFDRPDEAKHVCI